VLENLRDKLRFWNLGEKPVAPSGYHTLSWATFTKLVQSDVTKGTTSNDGVTPSDTAFNASVITCSPFHLRIVVNISDMVYKLNRIDFLKGAAVEVGNAMAEKIDYEIQAVIMAGTKYKYSSATHTTRASLVTGDECAWSYVKMAFAWLKDGGVPTFDGDAYAAVVHPFVTNDLMGDSTSKPNWVDPSTYVTPDKIWNGEIGKFLGIRMIVSDVGRQGAADFDSDSTNDQDCWVLGPDALRVVWKRRPTIKTQYWAREGYTDVVDILETWWIEKHSKK
jgi:N4-gp56 family major capsid protein